MLKKYFAYYGSYKNILYSLVLGSCVVALLDLLFPMLVRHVLNVELPQKNLAGMWKWIAILFVLYLGNFLLLYAINYYGHAMSASIENDMRRDLFAHLQKMPFVFFDNNKTGQLLSRITSDITEIGELTFRGPNDIIVCSITMVGTIIILFCMNIYLGGLIAFLLIVKTLHTIMINRKMKSSFRANRIKSGEVFAQAAEALSGIRLVKAFACEELELRRFMGKSIDYFTVRKESYKILAYFSGSVNLFTNLTNLAVLGCGGLLIVNNKLYFSDFIAFLLYVNLFMKPLLRLTVFSEMYQRGMAGFNRFQEIMQEKEESSDTDDAIECKNINGKITFENVSFAYSDNKNVLKNISLTIEPGEKVAFVGATGAGKTTIANLLLRFYELSQGKILLDNVDIKRYTQQSLRSNIGLVQQEVFLFSDSVIYNIAYAKITASAKEIKRAAKLAVADSFIDQLSETYDTCIGERGVKLSGGQKQRIAIARVFLKNPPVLILDEATSALDNKTEQQIQAALDKLSVNRTTIIIAHRLSTIVHADKIVVLHNGEIVECGNHQELIASDGMYKKLYDLNGE